MSDYHPPLRPTPSTPANVVRSRTITPLESPAIHTPSGSPLEFPFTADEIRSQVRAALLEDQAQNDLSTLATVDSACQVGSTLAARQEGVIAGVALAAEAFRQLDPHITIRVDAEDGTRVAKGASVMHLTGSARGMLSAERVALNYLQHLSGIATLTASFVDLVRGTSATILDTRKTLPGWRALQKYAVRAGGGMNHRMDLRSGVLIKDNHLAAIGGDIGAAVAHARALAHADIPVQVECDSLAQVDQAVAAGADWILLDNMSLDAMRTAVTRCTGKVTTEASGGVTLATVRGIAETGVDRISIGALTHSAPALDLALDFEAM